MRKKALVLCAAALLVLSMTACGDGTAQKKDTEAETMADDMMETTMADDMMETTMADDMMETTMADDDMMETTMADDMMETTMADDMMETTMADDMMETTMADDMMETTMADDDMMETTMADDDMMADGAYADGTYTAEAVGASEAGSGTVKVTVTIKGGMIDKIEIDAPKDSASLGAQAIKKLPDRIIEAQSVEVDKVSGASHTSEAILTAVGDCLDQASK